MKVELEIPDAIAAELLEQVRSGRHQTVEEVILERLSRAEGSLLPDPGTPEADALRRGIEESMRDRGNSVDGETVFARLRAKTEHHRARGE